MLFQRKLNFRAISCGHAALDVAKLVLVSLAPDGIWDSWVDANTRLKRGKILKMYVGVNVVINMRGHLSDCDISTFL